MCRLTNDALTLVASDLVDTVDRGAVWIVNLPLPRWQRRRVDWLLTLTFTRAATA